MKNNAVKQVRHSFEINQIHEQSDEDTNSNMMPIIYKKPPPNYSSGKTDDEILKLYQKLIGETPSDSKHVQNLKQNSDSARLQNMPKNQSEKHSLYSSNKLKQQKQNIHTDNNKQQKNSDQQDYAQIIKNTYTPIKLDIASKPFIPKPKQINKQTKQLPSKQLSPKIKQQNITNYSQGYKEIKPFNVKRNTYHKDKKEQEKKNSIESEIEKNKQKKVESQKSISTSQNFKKKLIDNIIKDKQIKKPQSREKKQKNRGQQQNKIDSKKLKDEFLNLNYEQTLLQAELRKLHLDNKERNLNLYKKYSINNKYSSLKQIIQQEILVLDEEPQYKAKQFKKLKFLVDDKQYVDQLKLELRKLTFLLEKKKQKIIKSQDLISKNPLYYYLYEYVQEQNVNQQSEIPKNQIQNIDLLKKQLQSHGLSIQQFIKGNTKENNLAKLIVQNMSEQKQIKGNQNQQNLSYKQIMKQKKNKAWLRNQRMNFDNKSAVGQNKSAYGQEEQIKNEEQKQQQIKTYEMEGGQAKFKVNVNLKNLLLQ